MNLFMYNHSMVRLVGAEGAEKILRFRLWIMRFFASFSQVSERKNERNECAEGALMVKCIFPVYKREGDSVNAKNLTS